MRRGNYSIIFSFIISALLAGSTPTFACSIHDSLNSLFTRYDERAAIEDYVEKIHAKKLEASEKLFKKIKNSQRLNASEKYDYVVVGSGLHGNLFSAVATRESPHLRGLVIDQGNSLRGSFKGGRTTWLTSPDHHNYYPGNPIQLSELNFTKAPLSTSQELGELSTFAAEYSKADYLLGHKTDQIWKDAAGKWHVPFDGTEVITDRVYFSTGLGKPVLPQLDHSSMAVFNRGLAEKKIHYLQDLFYHSKNGHVDSSWIKPFSGKDVAVVSRGAGAGAQAAVGLLTGNSDILLYQGLTEASFPKKIVWVGSPYQKAPDLLSSVNIDPIKKIATGMENGWIVNEHKAQLKKIEEMEALGEKKFRLTYENPDQSITTKVVDHVVIGYGYEAPPPLLNSEVLKTSEWKPFNGSKSFPSSMGNQLFIRGKPESVYQIGPVSGAGAAPEELINSYAKLPQSLESLGGRTEEMAKQTLPKPLKNSIVSYSPTSLYPTLHSLPPQVARIQLKMGISKAMIGMDQKIEWNIHFRLGKSSKVMIEASGYRREHLSEIQACLRRLRSDSDFMGVMAQTLAKNPERQFNIFHAGGSNPDRLELDWLSEEVAH